MQQADPEGPLRPAGLAFAAATAAAHLVLAVVSLRRSCRRYGDLLHGLCLHAGLVGSLQGCLVIALHALLYSTERTHDLPVWRICCKIYLFCRIFLPGLFFYLIAAITISFRSIRYPPRRCGRSCTRLGYLTAHCLPWAACSAGLLPVLIMHKEGTEAALRSQGRCLLIERWTWLGPISVLLGAPLLADLMLTCLLCAYKPYRSDRDSGKDDDDDDDDDSGDDDLDDYDNDYCGGYNDQVAGANVNGGGSQRHSSRRRSQVPGVEPLEASPHGNGGGGFSRRSRQEVNNSRASQQQEHRQRHQQHHGRTGRYFADSRLLRGRSMRLARTLLLLLSLLQACTQLPHCITAILQTVLRNLHSRQLIQQSAIDTLYWLHLAYFPVAGVLLTAFVLQLHRGFRVTEAEIERELHEDCGPSRSGSVREVLQTTSMLTSL